MQNSDRQSSSSSAAAVIHSLQVLLVERGGTFEAVLIAYNFPVSLSLLYRLACGIIARSAGLFQNPKQICACDGVTLWEERDRPIAGKGRRKASTETPAAHLWTSETPNTSVTYVGQFEKKCRGSFVDRGSEWSERHGALRNIFPDSWADDQRKIALFSWYFLQWGNLILLQWLFVPSEDYKSTKAD